VTTQNVCGKLLTNCTSNLHHLLTLHFSRYFCCWP